MPITQLSRTVGQYSEMESAEAQKVLDEMRQLIEVELSELQDEITALTARVTALEAP